MPIETIKILVVEDDDVLRELSVKVLEHFFPNAEIDAASNGMLGWELVRRIIPKVVLTDIGMPELNGIELLERIKREFPEIIVFIHSADIGNAEKQISPEKAISLGAAEAFEKGTLFSDITTKMRKYL